MQTKLYETNENLKDVYQKFLEEDKVLHEIRKKYQPKLQEI